MPLASVISEHLSSPEYLHVLLNPLPVYGLAVGVPRALRRRFLQAQILALAFTSLTPEDTCAIANFASNPHRNRNRENIIMTKNIITTRSFALALAALLAGCATTQLPPLSPTNPASAEAREGRTPPPARLHGDQLIQKANERLAGNAPVQPQYQPSEMGNMPGMQHDGMNMSGEQKPAKRYWTCVVHPQIKQDKRGKCPICGMNLVEKKGRQ
jgi:hypothetical protein